MGIGGGAASPVVCSCLQSNWLNQDTESGEGLDLNGILGMEWAGGCGYRSLSQLIFGALDTGPNLMFILFLAF